MSTGIASRGADRLLLPDARRAVRGRARRARRASARNPTSPAALGTPLGEPLPDARVLPPGTSHLMPFERPELIACLVADFPTTTPAPLMPIRRAGVAT
ncbi:MAG: hypothetical protein HOQ46_02085 [Saccharothrix sp.]|nr:hypothetical protein [Saccharothrix sp.]